MKQHAEIIYDEVKEQSSYNDIINKVINECFENEGLDRLKLYVSITLTNSCKIRELNNKYRSIDKETDVLSFPMFESEEIEEMKINMNMQNKVANNEKDNAKCNCKEDNDDDEKDCNKVKCNCNDDNNDRERDCNYDECEVLGDIVISINKVEEQAKEYGHSFERELAYMCVHSFYHLMGYDHMIESDKVIMRAKEDEILKKLHITREG